MSREIVVMGAGMVGVSVAWHLQNRGHRVVLVDRREPGRETSFGNAGIIQREAVRPYAFPRDLATLLRVLPNREVDIRYRLTGVAKAASPLLRYWHNSASQRYARIVPDYAALIGRSLDAHARMIEAAGAQGLIRQEGYIELFRTAQAWDKKRRQAESDAVQFGVEHQVLDLNALARLEPDLAPGVVGAIHWTQPWTSSDPGALVAAYAQSFERRGGQIVQASIEALSRTGSGWRVTTEGGHLSCQQVVLALGPWSARWLSTQGIAAPLFAKRGYHMHYGIQGAARLKHWLLEPEIGYLIAPMGPGIRLTTGAELAHLDAPPNYQQLAAAEAAARKLFPLGERLDPTPWIGARPCMPDMKPVIGPAPDLPGLWLAFGHGHQGFTLGPATGELLGQMMDGETPALDMTPYRLDRF